MGSASRFFAQFFPLFLLGALFGKLMEDSGAVKAIADFMTEKLGTERAVLAVVLGAWIGWNAIENRASLFWIDDQRLFMRRGILMRSEEEIELYRIKDVKVEFSIIQQMFDNGTICISSSDSTGRAASAAPHPRTMIEVTNVRDARAIRAELRDRVEAIRQRRGVREFDIG